MTGSNGDSGDVAMEGKMAGVVAEVRRMELEEEGGKRGSDRSTYVTILPPFFHFSHSHDFTCLLASHATYPVHPACASKSRGLSLLTLHSRALSSAPTFSFGSLRLRHGFLLRFSDSFVYDSLVPF